MKPPPSSLTYADAGVDISVADAAKEQMARVLDTENPIVLNRVGAFASLIDGSFRRYRHPTLVLKMEEPGSKQLLAAQHNRLEEVGYDLVNHLLNDVVVMGAQPIAVLDTIICGKLEKDRVVGLVRAMANACRAQGCELVGGETSEQPRVIPSGSYILSAAALGVVDRDRIIDGRQIAPGDVVVAVPSNGLHTNGYTLVRSLLENHPGRETHPVDGMTFIEAALLPHLCYSTPLQKAFEKITIHGLAHITGGGIEGNLIRVLPEQRRAVIELSNLRIPPVFHAIREWGAVPDHDMLRTFNLGAGLLAVLPPSEIDAWGNIMSEHGHACYPIGRIETGERAVACTGTLRW